jgi:hypothetical protein
MNEIGVISCCGRYDCSLCAYNTGLIVNIAKELKTFCDKYGSMRLIAEYHGGYDYDAFMQGLNWIASKEPCKGCRLGGGWSWWPDCPVRNCVLERGFDFCHQCEDFPCERLKRGPLPEGRRVIIEANKQMREIELDDWLKKIREKYALEIKYYQRAQIYNR